MCRIVNPTMSQEQQLQHLYRGLKPTLLQKIYFLQPASTTEFWTGVDETGRKELAGLLTGLQQTIEQLNHPQTAVSQGGLNASKHLFGISRVAIEGTAEGRGTYGFTLLAKPIFLILLRTGFRFQQNNRQEQPVNNKQQGLSGPRNNVQQRPFITSIFLYPDHYLQQETDGDLVPPMVSQPNTCHHQEGNGAWRSDTSPLN
ncbi:hypothetical protein OUZ56_026342 [Daphnia magna]|uniref:Uncharacterized protein n=1 Tax=Daphnia magna TaxID=35525 RepID=A0ABQ9ZLG3_9CRUS|nr:hypothetical protein OUZ56_026342 [Daphnia magna]